MTIEVASDCEIRSVIHFVNARKALPSDIHHQICRVYGVCKTSVKYMTCQPFPLRTNYNVIFRNVKCSIGYHERNL